ncbi:cell surface receptor major facilitator superfamily transporter transporter [Mucor ambiguus]|uniref:Cell surface receptor major facilitator superfamily transporter transporter n=1 Tax=Mucor ambiguus TaxID=91626 RepID=A0A0C9M8K9_9FUNG|nr:cell surface receptor major facilitator superfamily transporter transporter [Mucor ambiguus]
MPYSNRTSFMTAEQDSPETSRKASLEHNPTNNFYHNEIHFYGKSTLHSHQDQHVRSMTDVHLSPSSSISGDIESSHTVINGSSQTVYSLPAHDTMHKTTASGKAEADPNHHTAIIDSSATAAASTLASALPEPKTYPIAWLLLFFIVLIRAAVAIFANTFSPIPSVTADFMGISLSSINWLYNTMAICYIVASFFTSYLYKSIGVKWSYVLKLFLSGLILSVGCWIRWIAVKINPPSFPILMLGQTIASLSSPISLNIMTTFAVIWFTEDRRATAGMFIVSNYGAIIAMFLMPAIATGKDKIELTVTVVATIATVATIPFLFFPAKPPTPASHAAVVKESKTESPAKPELTLRQGTMLLLKNPHFLILLIIHSLNIGLSIAWNGLMNQAIAPYGYTDNEIGNIAAIGVVGGTFGCLMSGPIIDRTKQHKVLLKIMAPLMFSTYVAFIFVVKKDSFAAILYTNMLSQFFLSFMVPVCVELGVEISYPVTESLSTSILWQVSQLVGFILVLVMDLFRDVNGEPKGNLYKALIFQAAIAGVCFFFSMIFNGPMARTEALKVQERVVAIAAQSEMMANSTATSRHHYDSADTVQTLTEGDQARAQHRCTEKV